MSDTDEPKESTQPSPLSNDQLQQIIKSAIEGALAAQNTAQQHATGTRDKVKKQKLHVHRLICPVMKVTGISSQQNGQGINVKQSYKVVTLQMNCEKHVPRNYARNFMIL